MGTVDMLVVRQRPMQRGIRRGIGCHLLVSQGIVRELVAALGRRMSGCFVGPKASTPIVGVGALHLSSWMVGFIPVASRW